MKSLWGVLALTAALAACTKTEKQVVYQYPPADTLQSFSTASCAKKNCIKINKSSLNKQFLLIISGKSVAAVPEWMDLKPQIVVFQQSGSQVGMFALSTEAIFGNEDAKDLVQSFDIVGEDDTSVTFDWGQGFSALRQEGVFDTEIDVGEDAPQSSLRVLNSFISDVSTTTELIEIHQVSKFEETKLTSVKENPFDPKDTGKPSLETSENTYNLTVQIYPYAKNPNFQPKEADKSRTVGFFVTKTATPEVAADTKYMITKWDFSAPKGPVKYLISPNTPPEYLNSVREGILYWNKVFGFEAVTVEMAKSDRDVPPLHSVMVRWIPWEDAGFAYAQAQADPFTGEMLRGQLFMTPAFAHTKGYVKKLTPVINPMVACDFSKKFSLGEVDASNADEVRIAQDDIRSTIAHETGHSLGLRHNFAASASVPMTQMGVLQAISAYLTDVTNPGVKTATTVMDYLKGTEDILIGKYILSNPLPYDQMAMKWAYSADNKDLNPAVSKYCSDEDLVIASGRDNLTIYDCQQNDATGSSLTSFINNHVRNRATMLQTKYDDILAKLFPEDEDDYVADLGSILADNHVDLGLDLLKKQIGYHKKKDGIVSLAKWKNITQRGMKTATDPDLDKMLQADLAEVGGFAKAKAMVTPASSKWTQADLQVVLENIAKGQGVTKGRSYQLTADQQAHLTQYFKNEAARAETELQKQLNDLFKGL